MLYHNSYYQSFFKIIQLYSYSRGDLYSFLQELNTKFGEKVSCKIPGKNVHFLFCKEAVNTILVKREREFAKTRYTLQLDKLLGKGLLTSEGKHWQKNRKLIQPFFKQQSFHTITKSLEQEVASYLDAFANKMVSNSLRINLVEFIHALILNLTAKTLFGLNIEKYTEDISLGLQLFVDYTSQGSINKNLFSFHTKLRIKRFRQRMTEIITEQIANEGNESCNFLSYLVNKSKESPGSIDRKQIIDEALTMLFAGHETTANVLCWSFVELATEQVLQERLIDQARGFGSISPSLAQVQELKTFEDVFFESLRLYPPAWVLAREVKSDLNILNLAVKKKDLIVIPTWFIQRNKHYWDDPNCFKPERFSKNPNLHDGSFFPFSMGARTCIGRQLAHAQANLILCNFFKHFKCKLLQAKPQPQFQVLLRPPQTIPVQLEKL
ncbi:MAG: cytochrome P450 [Oligoflexales bacterium]